MDACMLKENLMACHSWKCSERTDLAVLPLAITILRFKYDDCRTSSHPPIEDAMARDGSYIEAAFYVKEAAGVKRSGWSMVFLYNIRCVLVMALKITIRIYYSYEWVLNRDYSEIEEHWVERKMVFVPMGRAVILRRWLNGGGWVMAMSSASTVFLIAKLCREETPEWHDNKNPSPNLRRMRQLCIARLAIKKRRPRRSWWRDDDGCYTATKRSSSAEKCDERRTCWDRSW